MSASRIRSVGELRKELAKYDDNNLIFLEVRDEWGAVHDYSPFYIDIVEWNNIDLTDRSEQNCSCGKKASLYHTIDNIQKYYCKVHSKKIVIEQKSFEHYFKLCDEKSQCQH